MTLTLTLQGAQILADGHMQPGEIGLAEGKLTAAGHGRSVDLSGYWVLPACVDIHGDGFERHLAPRRGAMKDLGQGLISMDAELASNGIGTATLAQFFSWEGGMRGPDFAARFLAAHAKADLLTETLVQLRFETHLLKEYAAFEELVAAFSVPYVVFNDHLPHAALAKGKRPPRLTGQALKSGRSPENHLAMLQALHDQRDEVPAALAALAARLSARGLRLGTHDDATAQDCDAARALGANLAEFPETHLAAEATRAAGGHIILGAPNVVRGGSHSGNVSAVDLIADGLCDALASDYHYPALKQAAFALSDPGVLPFAAAWHLVSGGPASLLGLADRGEINVGARADLVVLDPESRRIEATIVGGRMTHLAGGAAERFVRA
ncbi:alpha-D-ribose 1-methylphosphonate 5-triphosphate diphosphatase [Cognatishimia sp. SS12]|uniref:alpha-D-ribose 1-methylphosphonate 5-triphosphate diphosphatase n=1 Tax=Cognatishimia sp. SS12 TaxID=2979465 RepID=UPI00233022E5|nr:alpha-D-ribose 1-methylphosphonate 5-triphosphate diphosphatase [Cognatishimia sp. SS12]MDC0738258.1 alpha-D-ribose 1-methylphosphonate 5-triphosphate diphosphatase [Cognatishimia sp. SS12]